VPAPKNAKNPLITTVASAAFPTIFFPFARIVFIVSSHLLATLLKHPSRQKVAATQIPFIFFVISLSKHMPKN